MAQVVDTQVDDLVVDDDPKTYTTSRGVVLRLKRVSSLIVKDAIERVKAPKVPKVYREDKQANEDNPNDPDYIEAVNQYNIERGTLTMSIYYTLGTEIATVPEGFARPESDDWIEELSEIAGLEIPAGKPRTRYLNWIKYIALEDSDIQPLMTKIMRLAGLTLEVDVATAADSFRNNPARDSSIGVLTPEEDSRGNHLTLVPAVSSS